MKDIGEKLALLIVSLVSVVILLLTIIFGPWVAILLVATVVYVIWKLWKESAPGWPW